MRLATSSAVATILIAAPLAAAQFAVEVEGPVPHARPGLLGALRVTEIDDVTVDSRHFIILDAPTEAYVEAYAHVLNIPAVGLYLLEADWNGAGLSTLPVEARMPFMLARPCDFCSN